jgi:hypothetical protein
MLKVCVVTTAFVLVLGGEALASSKAGTAPAAIIVIDGIHGESKSKPGAIDASAVSPIDCIPGPLGATPKPGATASQAATSPRDPASGVPTGKRQHKPITITKTVDKASPALMKAATAGTPIPKATIVTGGVTYELEGILIGMNQPGGAGGAKPTETLTLNFAKCTRR